MSANPSHTDYFSINTTKIYSANPSGNFTVTSLPLTRRHLQDLESPSHYNLLFDLIANKFSKTPLHRASSQQTATSFQKSTNLICHQRPNLSATKSADAVLTPQRREHQQGRGCTKFTSTRTTFSASPPKNNSSVEHTPCRHQGPQQLKAKSEDTPFASLRRARPRNSPYESPSRIAARSVGALLALPEHTLHKHKSELPFQPASSSRRPTEVVLPRHNTILSSFHSLQLNATRSADSIQSPQPHSGAKESRTRFQPPQRVSSINLSSNISLPNPTMAPEHPHHLDPDTPDPFTAFGNPHQRTILSPHDKASFSLRDAKRAAQVRAAEQKSEQKQKERADKASKKIERENAEAKKRAQKEQREGAEKMRKLERDAEKQRLRREAQTKDMEKKRRREEEKERVVELRRHKRALGGMSWGFDPGAGTRGGGSKGNESGSGSRGTEAGMVVEGGAAGGDDESGSPGVRTGTTWGVTSGGPGRIGGYHGSDVSRM